MSNKILIKGALILTIASLLTKFMGFFYRVYMSQTIGSVGLGLYQLIMPIYMLTWSITSSGITTTVSKLVAAEKAKYSYGNIRKIANISFTVCFLLSIIVGSILFFFSKEIALYVIKDERTMISLKILSFAIPFMAIGSCIRGYFFGIQNQTIPALSQVLEQTVRILAVFLFAERFVKKGIAYACGIAVIGIVLGEILSFIFVFIFFINKNENAKICYYNKSRSYIDLASQFFLMAIPLTLTRVISSFLTALENILIPQRLMIYCNHSEKAISLFGKLTGMAMPLIQFPSALLVAVSVTIVPEISKLEAIKETAKIKKTVSYSLLLTSTVSIFSAILFFVFPKQICTAVYSDVSISSLVFKLSFICPFIYMQTSLNGLLSGFGKHFFIFINNIIASVITIFFIYFIVPQIGINGFLLGWLLSLVITFLISIVQILRVAGLKLSFKNIFLKPLLAGAASSLTIRYLIYILNPNKYMLLFLLFSMSFLYLIFLLALKVFDLKKIL